MIYQPTTFNSPKKLLSEKIIIYLAILSILLYIYSSYLDYQCIKDNKPNECYNKSIVLNIIASFLFLFSYIGELIIV